MRSFIIFILLLIAFFPGRILAQEVKSLEHNSTLVSDKMLSIPDSVDMHVIAQTIDTTAKPLQPAFKPDPKRALIYSAIFPGLGQIYNRKYWKLPLVYGGFMGCIYAISWNTTQYKGYKNAYNDITDKDPTTNSWINYLRIGTSPNPKDWTSQDESYYVNYFKNKRDFYQRNRDLSRIVTVGLYALCMIDAYVDAQLFDFDISPDLSMRMEPVFFQKTSTNSQSIGLQCSFNF